MSNLESIIPEFHPPLIEQLNSEAISLTTENALNWYRELPVISNDDYAILCNLVFFEKPSKLNIPIYTKVTVNQIPQLADAAYQIGKEINHDAYAIAAIFPQLAVSDTANANLHREMVLFLKLMEIITTDSPHSLLGWQSVVQLPGMTITPAKIFDDMNRGLMELQLPFRTVMVAPFSRLTGISKAMQKLITFSSHQLAKRAMNMNSEVNDPLFSINLSPVVRAHCTGIPSNIIYPRYELFAQDSQELGIHLDSAEFQWDHIIVES